jgi:hypothetical protein
LPEGISVPDGSGFRYKKNGTGRNRTAGRFLLSQKKDNVCADLFNGRLSEFPNGVILIFTDPRAFRPYPQISFDFDLTGGSVKK